MDGNDLRFAYQDARVREEHNLLHEMRDLLVAIYEAVRLPGSEPWDERR